MVTKQKDAKEIIASAYGFSDIKPLKQELNGVVGYATSKPLLLVGTYQSGERVLIKCAGRGSTAEAEIVKNANAYEFGFESGIDIFPRRVDFVKAFGSGLSWLAMDYGERNMVELGRAGKASDLLYSNFRSALRRSYNVTFNTGKEVVDGYLKYVIDRTRTNLESISNGGIIAPIQVEIIDKIAQRIGTASPVSSSWIVGDPTPENVVVMGAKLMFVDPGFPGLKWQNLPLIGLPQIELAAYATLFNIYSFAQATDGAAALRSLSIELAKKQALSTWQEEALWTLGIALQYSLSSKYRIGVAPNLATIYGEASYAALEDCLNMLRR